MSLKRMGAVGATLFVAGNMIGSGWLIRGQQTYFHAAAAHTGIGGAGKQTYFHAAAAHTGIGGAGK